MIGFSSLPHLSFMSPSLSMGEGNDNPLQYSCLENPRTEEPGGLSSMGTTQGHEGPPGARLSPQDAVVLEGGVDLTSALNTTLSGYIQVDQKEPSPCDIEEAGVR